MMVPDQCNARSAGLLACLQSCKIEAITASFGQVAGFSVESDGKYEAHCKTVLPSTYKQQRLPDAKSSIHLYELNDSTSKRTPLQYSGAMWVTDHRPGHSPIEGHLFLHVDALPKYKTKANFQQLLSSCQLHEDATDAIAEQVQKHTAAA